MHRRTFVTSVAAGSVLTLPTATLAQSEATPESPLAATLVESGYAPVNGLELYYEIHGEGGTPILVMHGSFMSIDSMAPILVPLAAGRQVIAFEMQGHGRTADIDRPITYENMADDAAALLDHLGIASADVLGYSLGGGCALQLAIRHPEKVQKLVPVSCAFRLDGWFPEILESIATITPEVFAGSPFETEYMRLAPNTEDWPVLIEKLKAVDGTPYDWPAADLQAIASPALVVVGDADAVQPHHAVEMFTLLGGGVPGDLTGIPKAQLAVFPGTTHTGVMFISDLLAPTVIRFLDAKPETQATPVA